MEHMKSTRCMRFIMYGIHYMDAITHMDENGHMFEVDLIIQWMKCDVDEIAFVRKMAIIHIG